MEGFAALFLIIPLAIVEAETNVPLLAAAYENVCVENGGTWVEEYGEMAECEIEWFTVQPLPQRSE